jgi:glycosyltransferase involved in cell wall biosynthesis
MALAVIVADGPAGDPLEVRGDPLKIAMLAPPWLPVPPERYGGIEQVVGLLCEGLIQLGHQVTLFTAPGSRSSVTVREVLPRNYPDQMGESLYESDHVARVFDAVAQGAGKSEPFDLLHDHSGFTAVAFASRLPIPVVHTLHGPFTTETGDFYDQDQ